MKSAGLLTVVFGLFVSSMLSAHAQGLETGISGVEWGMTMEQVQQVIQKQHPELTFSDKDVSGGTSSTLTYQGGMYAGKNLTGVMLTFLKSNKLVTVNMLISRGSLGAEELQSRFADIRKKLVSLYGPDYSDEKEGSNVITNTWTVDEHQNAILDIDENLWTNITMRNLALLYQE